MRPLRGGRRRKLCLCALLLHFDRWSSWKSRSPSRRRRNRPCVAERGQRTRRRQRPRRASTTAFRRRHVELVLLGPRLWRLGQVSTEVGRRRKGRRGLEPARLMRPKGRFSTGTGRRLDPCRRRQRRDRRLRPTVRRIERADARPARSGFDRPVVVRLPVLARRAVWRERARVRRRRRRDVGRPGADARVQRARTTFDGGQS